MLTPSLTPTPFFKGVLGILGYHPELVEGGAGGDLDRQLKNRPSSFFIST